MDKKEQVVKETLETAYSESLVQFLSMKRYQKEPYISLVEDVLIKREDISSLLEVARKVKGVHLDKIGKAVVQSKSISYMLRFSDIEYVNWKEMEQGIFDTIEVKIQKQTITTEDFQLMTIFCKNHIEADAERATSLLLQTNDFVAMLCFVTNVRNARPELFEEKVLQQNNMELMYTWKETMIFVSPQFLHELRDQEQKRTENVKQIMEVIQDPGFYQIVSEQANSLEEKRKYLNKFSTSNRK